MEKLVPNNAEGRARDPISEADREIQRGSERILLVDDEETILKLQKEIFEYIGYRVYAATNAFSALEEFKKNPCGFDLVITDQNMPNITGLKFAEELVKIRPDIPIILCTGYDAELMAGKVNISAVRKLVLKPLPIHDWAKIIRVVLDADSKKKPL